MPMVKRSVTLKGPDEQAIRRPVALTSLTSDIGAFPIQGF
jgi:hypothetical protein